MQYQLRSTTWEKDKAALSSIRRTVFIEEQRVPEELEWDEYDKSSLHILITLKDNTPIATGRMKPDGHIGRMAVLEEFRKTGIGTVIMKELLTEANKLKLKKLYLHAQTVAIPFYEKLGFTTCSDIFMDAGIPHKSMQLYL